MDKLRITRALAISFCLGIALTAQSGSNRKRTVELYLPFAVGTRYDVFQGQDQGPTHNDKYNRYAIDFRVPVGTPIHSSGAGIVLFVKEDAVGPTGKDEDNNKVIIRHADGTCGEYLHIKKDGALVKVGDVIYAGDPIALSGNTGRSGSPHLHFAVLSSFPSGFSIPCGFEDVKGKVAPKTGESPKSLNVRAREIVGGMIWLEDAFEVCRALDCRGALGKILKVQIGQKKLPRSIAQLIRVYAQKGRRGLDGMFKKRRDALRAICDADVRARRAELDEALAAKRHADAVRVSFAGNLDFEWHPEASGFRRAHSKLLRDKSIQTNVRPVIKELGIARARRSQLARAFESAWKARSFTGKRRKTAVLKLHKSFRAILQATPQSQGKTALRAWLKKNLSE